MCASSVPSPLDGVCAGRMVVIRLGSSDERVRSRGDGVARLRWEGFLPTARLRGVGGCSRGGLVWQWTGTVAGGGRWGPSALECGAPPPEVLELTPLMSSYTRWKSVLNKGAAVVRDLINGVRMNVASLVLCSGKFQRSISGMTADYLCKAWMDV